MIPSAEAARSTDDFRTSGTPGNGADGGGCKKKGRRNLNTGAESHNFQVRYVTTHLYDKGPLSAHEVAPLQFKI